MLAVAEVAGLLDPVATYCRAHERAAEKRMELPLADALRGLLDTLPAGRYRYPDLRGRLRHQHGARADRWSEERIGRVIKGAGHPRITVLDEDSRGRYMVLNGAATTSQSSDITTLAATVGAAVAAATKANRRTAAVGSGASK